MKYLLLLMIPLITCANVSAQKKLKIDILRESGDTIWSTSVQKIYNQPGGPKAVGDYLKTTLHRTKAGYSLELEIQTGRTNTFTISRGSAVDIELSDGSTVTLQSNSDNSSRISRLNYGCYIFAYYRIRTAEMKQLVAAPLKMIRVQASIGNMDYPIKEKFAGTLQEQVERISREE
ncbi:hypothetical protein LZZ85_05660 [Terrimonas sp. NA20]|uniref:DUF4468 domain-containing protein n=1 Tax=Terrimonas ginsenosidimutans TaxID=2908004 RepID=A0ABS9KN76_9BACT|nr:hypothetical protein [Terrimonas ginsenosidimutans]MCG2613754.1 hypothetical protein [Terrimonas ginsenosidimutans]